MGHKSSGSLAFDANASEVWRGVLGGVRDVIRQELVARQLALHLPQGQLRILDVGCGQGSQAIRLARKGHQVIGLDPSPEMLDLFRAARHEEDPEVRGRINLVNGFGEKAVDLFGADSFDVVLCHGVIAYLPDSDGMLDALAAVLRADGLLSLLTINGDALAMQPGMAGEWNDALAAFDEKNHITRSGVPLRAVSRVDLLAMLDERGLDEAAWYGLRVFTDRSQDTKPEGDLTSLFELEERAGRNDPYRAVAAFIHTLAVPAGGDVLRGR
jgi:S-adenosylmethionine-dependent methyltransferase